MYCASCGKQSLVPGAKHCGQCGRALEFQPVQRVGRDLIVWNLETGSVTALVSGTDGNELDRFIDTYSVSPDGSTIVFLSEASNLPGAAPTDPDDPWAFRDMRVYFLDVATGDIAAAPFNPWFGGAYGSWPTFAPDGAAVDTAYERRVDGMLTELAWLSGRLRG